MVRLVNRDKGRLQGSSLAARKTIDRLDERQYLAGCLADLVRNRPDDEEVSLADAQTPIGATSVLATDGADKAAVRDVLIFHGFPYPRPLAEVRNVIRCCKLRWRLPPRWVITRNCLHDHGYRACCLEMTNA